MNNHANHSALGRPERYLIMAWQSVGVVPFIVAATDNLYFYSGYLFCLLVVVVCIKRGVIGHFKYRTYLIVMSILAFGARWAFNTYEHEAFVVALVTFGIGLSVGLWAIPAIRDEITHREPV